MSSSCANSSSQQLKAVNVSFVSCSHSLSLFHSPPPFSLSFFFYSHFFLPPKFLNKTILLLCAITSILECVHLKGKSESQHSTGINQSKK